MTLWARNWNSRTSAIVAVTGAEFEVMWTAGRRRATRLPGGGRNSTSGSGAAARRAGLPRVGGGVEVPPVLGSRATHLISAMGGIGGRALAAGDRLPWAWRRARPRGRARASGERLVALPAAGARSASCRVRRRDVRRGALDTLQSAPYTVGQLGSHGLRLEGPRLTHARGADIISDATPLGALQVPASGQPILLMADRQTTGGYPKIATVITADMAVAGQLAPGDTIAFSVVHAARGDGGADRAGTAPDGARVGRR